MDAENSRMQMMQDFAENYMEKLFYFCMKKTGSMTEAEDLTQDIALQIFSELKKGTIPQHFPAWVWQIARNRYSFWADERHKYHASVSASDIGDYEIEDGQASILDDLIRSEDVLLLRRELAFIRSDYRYIVVAYYIENKSIREIASALSISKDAVEQRLHRSRMILKEGMEMAREFGIRSYKPDQVTFVMNGKDGKKGQPWSIITHLMYKNIFLETHENPQTAEALSLELGISLPYMEDELAFLVSEQLLRKEGNKYQVNFPIISREEQRTHYEENQRIRKPLTDKLCAMIDLYMKEDGSKVDVSYVGYEAAKWALLVRTFDWMVFETQETWSYHSNEYQNSYPIRPNDGAWTLTGYETVDWQEPAFVGQHGYRSYDVNEVKRDIDFGQFKFFIENQWAKTPEHLTWTEAYNLWLVCMGKIDECEKQQLDKLLEYGYLKNTDGVIQPNVVIFDRNAEKPYHAALTEKLTVLRDEICELIRLAPSISRGYVVEQALSDGWLRFGSDTLTTIGAYIYK